LTSTTADVVHVCVVCQACTSGRYGRNCAEQCQCSGSQCHPETGECVCEAGRLGPNCSQGHSMFSVFILCWLDLIRRRQAHSRCVLAACIVNSFTYLLLLRFGMLKGQGLGELSPSPENLFHLEMACA